MPADPRRHLAIAARVSSARYNFTPWLEIEEALLQPTTAELFMAQSERALINTRSMSAGFTGVQRYISELSSRLNGSLEFVVPRKPLQGLKGHLWEQLRLPAIVGSRLLWSPANTGPVLVRRQVVTVHDVATLDHPEWFQPSFAAWYRWMTPRLVRRARRVMVVSEFTKQRLLQLTGIDSSRIAVVHNGVDQRFRPRSEAEILQVRERLNLQVSRYILSLGSLEPRKNLERLLQAWSRAVSELPKDVSLVIVGGVGATRVFKPIALVNLPPRVVVTGAVSDRYLPALYSGALAMTYLSLYEGFGLPPLEAMACGTIAITGNLTSLPEIVGSAAMTVDPYSTEAIAEAIVELVKNPSLRSDLKRRSFEQTRPFTWESAAAGIKCVLADAMAN